MFRSSEDGEIGLGKQEVNGRDDDSEIIRNVNGFVHSIVDHAAAQLKNQYELLVPHELELRSSGAEGVWTKTTIPRGTKYGPYIGKWLQKPIDMRFAWEAISMLQRQ
ncbi:hypothetical protein V9T40_014629 [Parthenolecanium corni]|uniref:Uncharacterized protein n=1 Tax=Parthenolecanium corni TaxID=536013 RepID=A0AAN9XX72_9HEMI